MRFDKVVHAYSKFKIVGQVFVSTVPLGHLLDVGGAFLIRYLLQPYIEPYAPFHFFIVACLFISYLYGYKLALIATVISSLLGSYFLSNLISRWALPR